MFENDYLHTFVFVTYKKAKYSETLVFNKKKILTKVWRNNINPRSWEKLAW